MPVHDPAGRRELAVGMGEGGITTTGQRTAQASQSRQRLNSGFQELPPVQKQPPQFREA